MSEQVFDDGETPYGVRKRIHVSDDVIIEQNTFDAEPILDYCAAARQATEGKRWGDGKVVGSVPMHIFSSCLYMDADDQHKFLANYLRENPAFVTFEKFLK